MALRQVVNQQAEFWDLFRFSWDREGEGLDQTLAKVIEHCAVCFEASGASLFLNGQQPDLFDLVARSGCDGRIPKHASVKKGEGIAGACVELGRPLVIADPKDHPALFGRSVKKRDDIGSAMVIPLMAGQACIGVMNLSRSSNSIPFCSKDLGRAESVVRHIALAIENARLFAEAKAATQNERKLQTRLHEIVHRLGVAIIVVDRSEKITEANREALKLLGHESGGTEFAGLMTSVLKSIHAAVLGEDLRTRYHDDKSGRSWSISCTPLSTGGATAAIEELTEHERAEREMSRLHRLAEIGQMTATVAHEIRNPLTSIVAASRVLQDSPEQCMEFGKMIEEEALKLNSLCDQFLEFAKPIVLRKSNVNLAVLAKKLALQHQAEFEQANVGFEILISPQSSTIEGDPAQLEQVMRNLILNALQASEAGGKVSVKIGRSGFAVQDTGVGMSDETKEKLFAPFYTTKPKGAGLGLSNVSKILSAHEARISMESELGAGSKFEVKFCEAGK